MANDLLFNPSSMDNYGSFVMDKFDLLNGVEGYNDNWFQSGVVGQGAETGNPEYGTMFSDQGRQGLDALFGAGNYNFNLGDNMSSRRGQFDIMGEDGNSLYNAQYTPDGGDFMTQLMNTVMPGLVAGAFTGGLGLDNLFARGAASGGLNAGMTGGNVLQGALKGAAGAGAGSLNPAGQMGISNPILGSAVNRGFGGGVSAGLSGGDIGKGMLSGAAQGAGGAALNQGFNYLGSMMQPQQEAFPTGGQSFGQYQPGPASSAIADMTQMSRPNMQTGGMPSELTMDMSSMFSPGTEQTQSFLGGNDFTMPTAAQSTGITGSGMTGGMGAWDTSDIGKKFRELLSGLGKNGVGDTLVRAGLGAYGYNKANKAYSRQIDNLQGMFGPNSPYAQQMRQTLDRKDAAAGRRSQYGPREVELQARLAEANSRNAPQLAQLHEGQNQNRSRLLNTGYQLAKPYLSKLFEQGPVGGLNPLDTFLTYGSSGD